MRQENLLGDKYKAMYDQYYDAKVAEKRAIAADDIYSHLCAVLERRDLAPS